MLTALLIQKLSKTDKTSWNTVYNIPRSRYRHTLSHTHTHKCMNMFCTAIILRCSYCLRVVLRRKGFIHNSLDCCSRRLRRGYHLSTAAAAVAAVAAVRWIRRSSRVITTTPTSSPSRPGVSPFNIVVVIIYKD